MKNKALVVYDSAYGNTAKIARKIAESIRPNPAKCLLATQVTWSDVVDVDLLIVGSPTQGGRPTAPVMNFIHGLPKASLAETRVAAFDTRFGLREHGVGLRLLMQTIGFAAPKIERELMSKGGQSVAEPEGFIVSETEGPLKPEELEHAAIWARIISNAPAYST